MDILNYFSQIPSEQNEQDQRPRTPEHKIYSSGADELSEVINFLLYFA
jgi:hypothetical protein